MLASFRAKPRALKPGGITIALSAAMARSLLASCCPCLCAEERAPPPSKGVPRELPSTSDGGRYVRQLSLFDENVVVLEAQKDSAEAEGACHVKRCSNFGALRCFSAVERVRQESWRGRGEEAENERS